MSFDFKKIQEGGFFVVLAEYKDDAPIVHESYLVGYEDAAKRMESLRNDGRIVRVAIARLEFITGNKTLFNGVI